jgi:undecaprenyl-diphosphatase
LDLIQSIILGAIQGITEFFPISSTAHLVLLPWFFSWKDQGLPFNVALHVGSLIAIIFYFWRDWILIGRDFLKSVAERSFEGRPSGKIGMFLLIATVPALSDLSKNRRRVQNPLYRLALPLGCSHLRQVFAKG